MEIPDYIKRNYSGTIEISGAVREEDRKTIFSALFSNYNIRFVYVNDLGFTKEYIVGRGSHGALKKVKSFALNENRLPLLEVGAMTNIANGSLILVDGEHTNESVINICLNAFPCKYKCLVAERKIFSPTTTKGKTVIGNAVLISSGAVVLSGVKIGDGAVVGAEAVVTKDVPPFSIVVGNPAKVIRYRFDEETIKELLKIRWWDFELEYLFSNLPLIQKMKTDEFIENFGDISKNKYASQKNRFVFAMSQANERVDKVKCAGCDIDGEYVPLEKLNKTIQFYANQYVISKSTSSDTKMIYGVNDIFQCMDEQAGLPEDRVATPVSNA